MFNTQKCVSDRPNKNNKISPKKDTKKEAEAAGSGKQGKAKETKKKETKKAADTEKKTD